jgi:hypothetical protein
VGRQQVFSNNTIAKQSASMMSCDVYALARCAPAQAGIQQLTEKYGPPLQATRKSRKHEAASGNDAEEYFGAY